MNIGKNFYICTTNEIDKSNLDNSNILVLKVPINLKLLVKTVRMCSNIIKCKSYVNKIPIVNLDLAKEILIKDLLFQEEQAHRFIV